jgi:excisionase family DNA binding protein
MVYSVWVTESQVPLLTAKEAAKRLHVHVNTVKRMIRSGALPHYRFGERGDIRLSVEDVDAWLRARRKEGTDGTTR